MRSIKLLIVLIISATTAKAQISNLKTETAKVYGNCGMCETTIEKAAYRKKIAKADWNEETKIATITYDRKKTNLNAVLKNIALAGYDNEKFLAPDETYNKLHGCCKYERVKKELAKNDDIKTNAKPEDHTGHDQNAMHTPDTMINGTKMNHNDMKGKSSATKDTNSFQASLEHYFDLKEALVKSNGSTASEKSSGLLSSLNAVKIENLNADEHSVWMKVKEDLILDAQKIAGTIDISKQREHFATLSQNMYTLIKGTKPTANIYYQNCPMYNEGKGANWLSKESSVKNPYYGSMMLTCGKTVETIQ